MANWNIPVASYAEYNVQLLPPSAVSETSPIGIKNDLKFQISNSIGNHSFPITYCGVYRAHLHSPNGMVEERSVNIEREGKNHF